MNKARSLASVQFTGWSTLGALLILTAGAPTGAQAQFNWTLNESGGVFNFSAPFGAADPHRQVRMADPTILSLINANGQREFFVTGTSDDHHLQNFPIFRSTDLRHWTFFKVAFPPDVPEHNTAFPYPSLDANSINFPLTINQTTYRFFWSPQLYVDPREPDSPTRTIYLCFAAADMTHRSVPLPNLLPDELMSARVATITKTGFLGSSFFGEPLPYGYRLNNVDGSPLIRDGGFAQGGPNHPIPVTGSGDLDGGNPPTVNGAAHKEPSGWEFNDQGTAPWMFDAPFVFFDPREGQRGWLTYSWHQVSGSELDGNNIAAYPLLSLPGEHLRNNSEMDALTPATNHIPLFFRYNDHNLPGGGRNGGIDLNGGQWQPQYNAHPYQPDPTDTIYTAGVAEGSAALYYEPSGSGNHFYYVFGTRNTFDSPAYMTVYRMSSSAATFWEMKLPPTNPGVPGTAWTNQQIDEGVLVASNWIAIDPLLGGGRDLSNYRSFGHGDVFKAWGRNYFIFHAKMGDTAPGVHSRERRIFIKELAIDAQGGLARLYDGAFNDSQNLNKFRACRADWNHDDLVNSQDFYDFLAAFQAGVGDFNEDGVNNSQDFFDFLTAFFNPCP